MNQDQYTDLPAFVVLSHGDIAVRAYELFMARGAADGFDREDWLRAEHELKERGEAAERRGDGDHRPRGRLRSGARPVAGRVVRS